MLTVTVFISLVLEFTGKDNATLRCISDNQELINRMTEHEKYEHPFPNETTKSEFDITEQIFLTAREANINASYEWVKGHQDDNAPIDELPIEAQLNILADTLAGEYQHLHGSFRPLAHLLPSCPAMVSIRGISVTSNIFKQLVRAYTEPRYIDYLQEKFNWSSSDVRNIAWKSLALAIERIDRGTVILKVCNDILPNAVRLHRMSMSKSDKCPLCSASETTDHMIQCPDHSRTQWRCKTISELRQIMKKHNTNYNLSETLLTAIASWMDTGFVDVRKFPVKYRKAINTQTKIGWQQIFMGQISQEWLQLYEDTYKEPPTKDKTQRSKYVDGYIWGANIEEILIR